MRGGQQWACPQGTDRELGRGSLQSPQAMGRKLGGPWAGCSPASTICRVPGLGGEGTTWEPRPPPHKGMAPKFGLNSSLMICNFGRAFQSLQNQTPHLIKPPRDDLRFTTQTQELKQWSEAAPHTAPVTAPFVVWTQQPPNSSA